MRKTKPRRRVAAFICDLAVRTPQKRVFDRNKCSVPGLWVPGLAQESCLGGETADTPCPVVSEKISKSSTLLHCCSGRRFPNTTPATVVTTCVEPMLAVLLPATGGFVACSVTTSTSVQVFAARSSPARAHWMDHLKFGGSTPTFDVLEKTKEYAACKTAEEFLPLYADDYVFRGSIRPHLRRGSQRHSEGVQHPHGLPRHRPWHFRLHHRPREPVPLPIL